MTLTKAATVACVGCVVLALTDGNIFAATGWTVAFLKTLAEAIREQEA